MLRAIQKRLKNKKGFTLVELIVVIAVLGILSGIAVPKFVGSQDKARRKADVATVKALVKATELAVAEEEITLPSGTDIKTVNISDDLVDDGYLDAEPKVQSKSSKVFVITVDSKGKIVGGIGTITSNTGNITTTLYPTITDTEYQ